MNKYFVPTIFIFLIFSIFCTRPNKIQWSPIIEVSSIGPILDYIDITIKNLQKVKDELNQNNINDAKNIINEILSDEIKIKNYYIPLIKIKDKIHNSYRLIYLNQKSQAQNLLKESKDLVKDISEDNDHPVKKECEELDLLIEDLIFSIDEMQQELNEKYIKTAEKLDSMILKGELFF